MHCDLQSPKGMTFPIAPASKEGLSCMFLLPEMVPDVRPTGACRRAG